VRKKVKSGGEGGCHCGSTSWMTTVKKKVEEEEKEEWSLINL
jgi:hypothetical protein